MTTSAESLDHVFARVTWGPRTDSAAQCAERWRNTIWGLAKVDPILTGWTMYDLDDLDDTGEPRPVPMTDADLLPVIQARTSSSGDGDANLGHSFGATNGESGERWVFFHASAGLTAPVAGLLNTAGLATHITSPAGRRWWATVAEPALTVLVDAWEPDHGEVASLRLQLAQRPGPRQPIAGSVTYLSAHRRQFVPADLAATGRPTQDGGLLLSLISKFGLPVDETVIAQGARLHDAGAFEPIPVDRTAWWHQPL